MLQHFERILVKINNFIVILMLMIMFVLVFINVITRYSMGFSMNWAEEVSRYLMIWIAYLGIGLAMREKRHASFQVLYDILPKKYVPYIKLLVSLIIIIFMIFLVVLGFQYSQFAMRNKTAVLRLPIGYIYLCIPIGALTFLLHFILILKEYITAKEEHDEIQEPKNIEGKIKL